MYRIRKGSVGSSAVHAAVIPTERNNEESEEGEESEGVPLPLLLPPLSRNIPRSVQEEVSANNESTNRESINEKSTNTKSDNKESDIGGDII